LSTSLAANACDSLWEASRAELRGRLGATASSTFLDAVCIAYASILLGLGDAACICGRLCDPCEPLFFFMRANVLAIASLYVDELVSTSSVLASPCVNSYNCMS